MNKRGQITIFITVAVLIIAIILLFLFLKSQKNPIINKKIESDPKAFLESCLEEKVREKIELISSQGGYIKSNLSKNIDGKNIAYLCYTSNNYVPCINQEPLLIQHLKKEIKNATQEDVESCFSSLKKSFEDKSYKVNFGSLNYSVDVLSKKIIIKIDRDLTITKSGETTNYNYIEITFLNGIYDLALIAQEITFQEAVFCNFNNDGYMMFYPDYNIEKFMLGDSTKLYTIKKIRTNEQFVFGIRSCAIPPGIG